MRWECGFGVFSHDLMELVGCGRREREEGRVLSLAWLKRGCLLIVDAHESVLQQHIVHMRAKFHLMSALHMYVPMAFGTQQEYLF